MVCRQDEEEEEEEEEEEGSVLMGMGEERVVFLLIFFNLRQETEGVVGRDRWRQWENRN